MPVLVYRKINKRNKQRVVFTQLKCDIGDPIVLVKRGDGRIQKFNRFEMSVFEVDFHINVNNEYNNTK